MNDQELSAPKVFISYNWMTSKDWTIELASRLVADAGIDVVLDVWDLKKGQDKYKFMEGLVLDPSVSKVLMICDEEYARKANERKSGVGAEATIISPSVYEKSDQTKFIVVIRERDAQNQAPLPAFMSTRIYIDLSNELDFEENFEDLVRCIYDKPQHKKPALAKTPPAYILDDTKVERVTRHKLRAFESALIAGKSSAVGLGEDFLDAVAQVLEPMEVSSATDITIPELKERVMKTLEDFLPYRDDFIDFVLKVGKYGNNDRYYEAIQRFFNRVARLVSLEYHPTENKTIFPDNYRFLVAEMFLYTIAAMINTGCFQQTNILLSAAYQDSDDIYRKQFRSYIIFQPYMKYLDKSDRYNHFGENQFTRSTLQNRATREDITYLCLVDADYLLYARHFLHPSLPSFNNENWISITVNDREIDYYRNGLPSFAKAAARADLDNLCLILDIKNKAELIKNFNTASSTATDTISQGRCQRNRKLMNLDGLDTL